MTIDWFSYAVQCGKDPGKLRMAWRAVRSEFFWAARMAVLGASIVLSISSMSVAAWHLMGQDDGPKIERLDERIGALQERVVDHEARIRNIENALVELKTLTKQLLRDVSMLLYMVLGLSGGVTTFALKELFKVLQERKR